MTTRTTAPTVLLLDDDATVLRSLVRVVRAAGFTTIATSSQREALETVMRGEVDIIVSDLHMPEMLGTVVLSMISRSAPHVGRVLLTGDEDFPRVASLLAPDSAQAFVSKIDVVDRLPDILRQLADRRAQSDSASANVGAGHSRELANGIVRALALRDVETEAHCHRVAALARRLAGQLGLTGEALLGVELGALLHDMGKIGVRDAVLLKPGKLTDDEWIEMRRHPELGARLLADMPLLRGAIDVVLNHHERWLGGGYPRGLIGDAIPLAARIFQIADTYDAIVSDRPYRKGQSPEQARLEIRTHAGKQFDVRVVDAFESIPADEWHACWRDAGAAARGDALAARLDALRTDAPHV